MADFTKKAIKDSFVKLLNEKPLKQITVKDIVDDCGVNRNTFYYHFQDIPQLIESMIKEDADKIISQNNSINSLLDCITAVIDFSLKNKNAVLHIYRSVNRDIYEQYQWEICQYVVTEYIDGIIKDKNISKDDYNLLINYIKSICFGIVMNWLNNGMRDDILKDITRLCELKHGDLEEFIKRCTLIN